MSGQTFRKCIWIRSSGPRNNYRVWKGEGRLHWRTRALWLRQFVDLSIPNQEGAPVRSGPNLKSFYESSEAVKMKWRENGVYIEDERERSVIKNYHNILYGIKLGLFVASPNLHFDFPPQICFLQRGGHWSLLVTGKRKKNRDCVFSKRYDSA